MVGVVFRGADVTTVGDKVLMKGDDDGWYVMDMGMSVGSLPNS
jgi:hypothetical protein